MYYLETIASIGLKVGLYIQIDELMKLNEYQRSRSLFDLGHRSPCDLDLVYAKINFGHIGFCIGKSENYVLFCNYCSHRPQSWFLFYFILSHNLGRSSGHHR